MNSKLRYIYDNSLAWVITVMLIVIVALTVLQVFMRYVMNDPLRWTEEVARLLLVWAVFLGAGAATKHNAHIRVDFAIDHLGDRALKAIELGQHVIVGAIGAVMVFYGWQFFEQTGGDTSTSLGYQRNLFYLPIPVGGALILVFSCISFVRVLLGSPTIKKAEEEIPVEERHL